MLRIGRFELYSVVTGTFGLDGGAMFGVIPRAMWSKVTQPDEFNRIPLATRTLVAIDRGEPQVILVDTGCGTKWEPKRAERFAIRHDAAAIDRLLQSIGLASDAVTDIVVTHLHFDHNGGLTEWADQLGGATRLCYPRARHWIHRKHWDHANRPHLKDRASFLPQDLEALTDSDRLCLLDGEAPRCPIDGVEWLVSHGHTPYQLHPVFGNREVGLLFAGDIVPTAAHVAPPWVMAYDMQPSRTIDEKLRIHGRCIEEGRLLAFPHDPELAGVALGGSPERPEVTRALTELDAIRMPGP